MNKEKSSRRRIIPYFFLVSFMILSITSTSAEILSVNPCDNGYNSRIQGDELILENACVQVRFNTAFTPNAQFYNKQAQENFQLMLMGLEERRVIGGVRQTPFSSLNLTGRLNDNTVTYTEPTGTYIITYSLTGDRLKAGAEINNHAWAWSNSELWVETLILKGSGLIYSTNPIVNNVSQPIQEETNTAGQNTFLYQRLGRGSSIILDPIFLVNVTPNPAIYLDQGNVQNSDDDQFTLQTDITTEMSDDLDSTFENVDVDGSNGMAIAGSFGVTFENDTTYFANFRKINLGNNSIRVRGYTDDNTIGSLVNIQTVSGVGDFDINITNIVEDETNNQGMNFTKYRLYSDDSSSISEIRLRTETQDNQSPVINNCAASVNNFTFNEVLRFSCNVTDNTNIETVNFTINNVEQIAMRNDTIYFVDITGTELVNITYNFSFVEAYDIFGQNTNQSLNITSEYIAPEHVCLEFASCVDGERQCLSVSNEESFTGSLDEFNVSCDEINISRSVENMLFLFILMITSLALIYTGLRFRSQWLSVIGALIGVLIGALIISFAQNVGIFIIVIFSLIALLFLSE